MVRGDIREWRKQNAIEGRRGAASLHALYYRDVFGEHNASGGVQIFTRRSLTPVDGGSIRLKSGVAPASNPRLLTTAI